MSDRPIAAIGETLLLPENTTLKSITDSVSRVTETKAPRGWWILFLLAATFTGVLGLAIAYLAWVGVGTWETTARSRGLGTSPTSSGGSASGTPAR